MKMATSIQYFIVKIELLKMKGSSVTSEHSRSLFSYLHTTGVVTENLVSKHMTMKTTQP